MTDAPRQTTSAASRVPDCVTEVRKGSTILTVSGYFKQNASETATQKMEKTIQSVESIMTMNESESC